MGNGAFTHEEILSQPEAWAEALDRVRAHRRALSALLNADYVQTVFTGCGSTYYLSLSAAALFQGLTGRIARAVPGGELLLNPETILTAGKTLLVAISRSGATTETVRAVEQFRQAQRGNVVVITCDGSQPLAALGDVSLVIEKGQEQSVAQTRSFTSMYVAATALGALAAEEEGLLASMSDLPSQGERLIRRFEPLARRWGEDLAVEHFFYLGSNWRYGLACEASLKMKEMSQVFSEAFHFLEFRHGPMSMVSQKTGVVGLMSGKNRGHEQAVLREMEALGSSVLTVGENGSDISFESGLPEIAQGVLYLPVLQLMAFHRAQTRGLDPDCPANLTAVVRLDL